MAICPRCKQPIGVGELVLVIRNEKHHAHHHQCTTCRRPLEPNGFREKSGKLYCLQDYATVNAPVCFVCKRPCLGRSVNAIGHTYHPEVRVRGRAWTCVRAQL